MCLEDLSVSVPHPSTGILSIHHDAPVFTWVLGTELHLCLASRTLLNELSLILTLVFLRRFQSECRLVVHAICVAARHLSIKCCHLGSMVYVNMKTHFTPQWHIGVGSGGPFAVFAYVDF